MNQAEAITTSPQDALASTLSNPVLPSGFDLVAGPGVAKTKWEFANGHSGPFGKAWKGLTSQVSNPTREE
jgi:hypothetical protein